MWFYNINLKADFLRIKSKEMEVESVHLFKLQPSIGYEGYSMATQHS